MGTICQPHTQNNLNSYTSQQSDEILAPTMKSFSFGDSVRDVASAALLDTVAAPVEIFGKAFELGRQIADEFIAQQEVEQEADQQADAVDQSAASTPGAEVITSVTAIGGDGLDVRTDFLGTSVTEAQANVEANLAASTGGGSKGPTPQKS